MDIIWNGNIWININWFSTFLRYIRLTCLDFIRVRLATAHLVVCVIRKVLVANIVVCFSFPLVFFFQDAVVKRHLVDLEICINCLGQGHSTLINIIMVRILCTLLSLINILTFVGHSVLLFKIRNSTNNLHVSTFIISDLRVH